MVHDRHIYYIGIINIYNYRPYDVFYKMSLKTDVPLLIVRTVFHLANFTKILPLAILLSKIINNNSRITRLFKFSEYLIILEIKHKAGVHDP